MRRLAPVLVLALIATSLVAGPAAAAEPLSGWQSWLPRVAPVGLATPPPEKIPPIAIIEDGYDPAHPDLAGDWVRVRRPYPVPSDGAPPDAIRDAAEGIAHGGQVAAIIGAPVDGVGIQGVLPGARVWIYGSNGSCKDAANAIRAAVRHGARVINASYGFGPGGACRAHHDATSFAFGSGALVVAAAGNDRPFQLFSQPANDLHVLTVGALRADDRPSGFSHQNIHTDIAAPGEGIFAPVPIWYDLEDEAQDGYANIDGTSFSAPMVSAAAAWVMARRPRLSADQVAQVLRRSARDLGRPGWDISTGWGALDIRAALRTPAPINDPYEPNDDIAWVAGRKGFKADRPFLRNRRQQVVRARLDVAKDPFDVYPVWIPARSAVQITLIPRGMAADLYVWKPTARTAIGRGAVAKSRRPRLRRERVVVRNRSSRGRRYWVEVRGGRGLSLAGDYRLALKRRG